MNAPGGRFLRLAVPVRILVQRFAFVLLIAAAFGLMILGKADALLVDRLRFAIIDAGAPVLEVLSHPVAALRAGIDEVNQVIYLRAENQRLLREVEHLSNWQTVARHLERENAVYRSLLKTRAGPQVSFVSARVIGDSTGPFVRTLLLNAGARDGIASGQAVVSAEGLVGRIAEAGARSSRVLLVTDLNSRIPVVIEATRHRAVLAGDNSNTPRLTFLAAGAQVKAGDRVITSGHGGLLPPGLPIGIIGASAAGATAVQLLVDWHRLEYVRVLRFDLPRLSVAHGSGTPP